MDIMKQRLTILSLMLCMFLGLHAQKLTVESFSEAGGDLSASKSENRRVDKSEGLCGLIKVQLPLDGVTFDGAFVIGDVQHKADGYWVYMNQGAYQLHIMHPSFHPLELNLRELQPAASDGFRGVQSLCTYKLVVNAPSPTVQTQTLTINYTPVNAIVVVDSKTHTGNGRVELTLPVGSHDYQIVAVGYDSAEGSVKLTASQPRTITENLAAATQPTTVQQPTSQPIKQKEPIEHNTQDAIDFQRRQEILKYLEVFRSYFNEKNIKALRDIFSDDALIISGNVVQRRSQGTNQEIVGKRSQEADQELSRQPELRYTKTSKEQYISRLENTFKRNNSVTVEFDQINIERHPTKSNIYGINFHQKWSSDRYSDSGYMFMLLEFIEGKPSVIHVRTWQPEMVGNQKIKPDEIFKMKDFPIK